MQSPAPNPCLHPFHSTLRLSSFMAAPPYLMTMVLPRKRCRYGSASDSTDTRSNALNRSSACAGRVRVGSVAASRGKKLIKRRTGVHLGGLRRRCCGSHRQVGWPPWGAARPADADLVRGGAFDAARQR